MHKLISFPLVFAICAIGGIALVFFGEIHSDEEFYFCAGRNVSQGLVPYRDFAFNQAPLFAYVYAQVQNIFGPSFYASRSVSLAFFLAQLLLVMWIAKRMGGRIAGLFAGATIALNSYVVLFGIQLKTYSLAGLLLTASIACLITNWPKTLAQFLTRCIIHFFPTINPEIHFPALMYLVPDSITTSTS